MLAPWKKSYDKRRECFKKAETLLPNKGPSSQTYVFSSSHAQMWELDHKEGKVPKNWCFWIVALEKTLESPLDCKEIKPVNPKGNQPWVFIGRTDAESKAPILCPHDAKCWLIGKDPDAGKDLRQEEKGTTEDKMVGWYHRLRGHEFEQTPGDSEGQGSLACCSSQGHKELDKTEWLNITDRVLAQRPSWGWQREKWKGLRAHSSSVSIWNSIVNLQIWEITIMLLLFKQLWVNNSQKHFNWYNNIWKFH